MLPQRRQSGLNVVKWLGPADRRTVPSSRRSTRRPRGCDDPPDRSYGQFGRRSRSMTAETAQAMIEYPARRCRAGCPGGSRSLYIWATRQARRLGGVARSIAERLASAASAPAQCRPGIGHRAVGCMYPQIAADQERATVDRADGGRDIRLLTGNTGRLVVQGPGRAAADHLGYQRRARGVRGDPRPVPGIEYLRKPAQALGEMPASLRVEIHGDLAALVRLPRPWPG